MGEAALVRPDGCGRSASAATLTHQWVAGAAEGHDKTPAPRQCAQPQGSRVEMAGIEPASDSCPRGLLRVQSTVLFSAQRIA